MGWGIALGVIALLVTLFMICPIGFSVGYNAKGFGIYFLAGRVRVPIPVKKIAGWMQRLIEKQEKKPKKPKEQKTVEQKTEKPKEEESGGPWTDFLPMVRLVPDVLNDLRRKIRVNCLQMHLVLAEDDPCDLALHYAKVWAAVGNIMPRLERIFKIKKKDIAVDCDFLASKTLVTARLDVTMTPARMLALSLRFAFRGITQYVKIINSRKGGASNEPNSP